MWRCAPLVAILISLVLSSWIPHLNSGYGLLNAAGNTSPLAHDALSSSTAASTAECEEDWVCGPGCEAGPPFKGPDATDFDEVVRQDTVPSESTPQPFCEKTIGLDRPAPGKLGSWAKHVVDCQNFSLTQEVGDTYNSTAILIPWGGHPFLATVSDLSGCTAVILTCGCGIYMAHLWEAPFKPGNVDAFLKLVLNALKADTYERDNWIGIPMLPSGCFTGTANTRLKALIFSRTSSTIKKDGTSDPHELSTVAFYPDKLQQIKDTLADALEMSADDIVIQLYTRKEGMRDGDPPTAMGKILVSYSPDVDNNQDNPRSGYEVWAGAVLENGLPTVKDSDVHEPIMSDFWTCDDLTDPSQC